MINRRDPKSLEETLSSLKMDLSGRLDPHDRDNNEVSTADLENAIHYLEVLKCYKTILERSDG